MRVLVLSDIHGNFAALEMVVGDAKGNYDVVWCLGDIVGYGPSPNECVAWVQENAELSVIGNHDWAVLGRPGIDVDDFNPMARQAVMWTRETLTPPNRDYLDSLPAMPLHPPAAPDVLLTHASPREPVWEYILTPGIALENFALFEELVCLVGHTHKPAIYRWQLTPALDDPDSGEVTVEHLAPETDVRMRLDLSPQNRLILNPGSVGQPRDNDPRAAYALFNLEQMTWEQKRITYPIDLTQSRMRAANLPRRLIDRLNYGW
jgi:predicted phosphodiesterase